MSLKRKNLCLGDGSYVLIQLPFDTKWVVDWNLSYVTKMGQLKLSETQSQRGGLVVTITESNAYKRTEPLCFYSATK